MKQKKVYLLILAVLLTSIVSAQTKSPYSRYGLGSFQQKGSIRVRTMGGAGIAMQNKTDVNNVNPSALVAMDSTAVLFDMGFHVNASNFSDGAESETVYSGNLDYVSLMLPMHKRWFLAATLQPITSVGYNINTVAKYNGSDPSAYYNMNFNGTGGMSLASVTNSFKLPGGISIGAEVGFLWGNHNETITESYSGMDVTSSTRENILYHKGAWLTTGAQYKLSLDKSYFILGLKYDIATNITSEMESTISSSRSIIEENTSSSETNKIPEGYGIGLSYNYNEKLTLSADYSLKKWGSSNFGVDAQRLSDDHAFSFGAELLPNFNSNKYLQKISYRAGAHYETGSFTVNGESVQKGYVSMGLGLPGRMNNTLISVGVEFGTIGGFNNKHITENYGQLNVGLNLGEIWFMKPKFW
ncbi:MAG: hypothetical protein PF444_01945 [Bacteroidales bacterium]|nr:hypothetical protein [Bacteroidales bacterium]